MLRIIATISFIQALAILVSVIRAKITAVLLGPEGVGVVSTIDQIVQTVAHVSAWNLPFAALRFLSRAHSEGDEAFHRSYAGFLKALLVLAVAGMLIAIGIVEWRPNLLDSRLAAYRSYLMLALLGLPTIVLGGFFINVLAAAQKPKASAMFLIISGTVIAVAACTGVWLNGIFGLYLGSILGGALVTLGTLIYFRAVLQLPLQSRGASVMADLRRAPETVRFAALMYVGTLAYSFSLLVARYCVLKNHGEGQAGLLQAVLAIGLAMIAVFSPANGWFLTPIMNRNIDKDEKIRAATEFQKKLIVPLSAASMVIVLFPQLVLVVLYSPQFLVAAQFVFLFVLWQWILLVAGVHHAMLIGFDDLKAYTVVMSLGYGSSVLGSWLLAPHYGIGGVAIAFVAGSTVLFLTSGWRLRSRHGLRLSVGLHLLICYSLAALAAVGYLFSQHQELTISIVLAKCGVYVVSLAGLLCFFNREVRISLHNLWQKVRLRGTR